MMQIRQSDDRGRSAFDWLDSRHTFSFGEYYDPQNMGYSALRVINDDRVVPGAGFGTHGHRDMEIITCVLEGTIAHKDSEGNVAELAPGEFQLMSAGSGIQHSEFNPSDTQALHFLQIWIQPRESGGAPGYQQKVFAQDPGLMLVASPDGAQGSLILKQDARLYQLRLPEQGKQRVPVAAGRRVWVHVIDGTLAIGDQQAGPGDGVGIKAGEILEVSAGPEPVRALIFDLP